MKKSYEEKNKQLQELNLSLENSYPKRVSYIKNTRNRKLKFYDYGTLIIERRKNLLSQIIKNFVRKITQSILNFEDDEIRNFMRGILAGESCVEIDNILKKFRVHISVNDGNEKMIYHNCLKKLCIDSIIYKHDKLVISKKQNNLQLLKQKLMTLSPKKYNKFLRMMKLYQDFEGIQDWRKNLQKPWNKIPQEKIDKIIKLHNQNPNLPAWKIGEQVGVSGIKVNRVLKENNLGKILVKTSESKRKKIAQFAKENLKLTHEQIAKIFNVHESVVRRACEKYKVFRGNESRCKIPEEKIKRIIEIYKQNPTVKYSEIEEEVGVSGSVIKRVRKENGLTHLGYKYIIGCNNPKKEAIIETFKKQKLRKLFK